MSGDVAAHSVVHERGRLRQRLLQIDNSGQRIELDADVGKRILGQIAALRQDDGQWFADVTHFVFGERYLGALIEGDVLNWRRRN